MLASPFRIWKDMLSDKYTTLDELKKAVIDMCIKKHWGGETGTQNPQHVAMAMTVEMSELLENFQWLDAHEVDALVQGADPERRARIAEEFADVMMYGLQLMRTLDIDVSREIEKKIGIVLDRPASRKGRETHT